MEQVVTGQKDARFAKNWSNHSVALLASATCDASSWRASLVVPVGLTATPQAGKEWGKSIVLEALLPLEDDDATHVTSLVAQVHLSFSLNGGPYIPLKILVDAKDREKFERTYEPKRAELLRNTAVITCTANGCSDYFTSDEKIFRDVVFGLPIPDRKLPFSINITNDTAHTTKRRFPLARLGDLPVDCYTDHLDLRSIQHLKQAAPSLQRVLDLVPTVRVRRILKDYFSDPPAFGTVLRNSGAVVGGSAVVSVLQPGDWAAGDMDMVVALQGFPMVEAYMLGEGYTSDKEVADQLHSTYFHSAGYHFKYFHFKKVVEGRERTIDLCRVENCSSADFILSYHSTTPMNYFDGDHVVCLFPDLFFNYQYALNILPVTDRLTLGLQKYHARGYSELPSRQTVQALLKMSENIDHNGHADQATLEDLKERKSWRALVKL